MSHEQGEPIALEVDPDSVLTFELHRTSGTSSGSAHTPSSSSSDASKCSMILRHPGGTPLSYAFKVKTTQPRRYLVRPNQGIIGPNESEKVSILLVAKDKHSLIQSYDRLGSSALEHRKDKFLVQSCTVSREFSVQFSNEKSKELSDALTSMWNNPSNTANMVLLNKKLHVKHVVVEAATSVKQDLFPNPTVASKNNTVPFNLKISPTADVPISSTDSASLVAEITSLRKKYDELVAFSVNLTAERDVLNNTLEQTKRELNIEKAARARLEGVTSSTSSPGKGSAFGFLQFIAILVLCFAVFVAGIKFGNNEEVDLSSIPYLDKLL